MAKAVRLGVRSPLGRCGLSVFIGLALSACASAPGWLAPPWADAPAREAGPAAEEPASDLAAPPYIVAIAGVPDAELRDLLKQASQLIALRNRPPATLAALRRRAEADLDRLQSALRSEGFYAAETRYEIDHDATPIEVRIQVETGPVYLLADYDVHYEGAPAPPPDARPDLDALGLFIGMPGRAPAIVAAEARLLERLGETGYPLAEVLDRKTTVDHDRTSMTVRLALDPGPRTSFGPVTVEGLERVAGDYVKGLVAWREGETYDRRKIAETRRALTATELFSSVRVRTGAQTGRDGRIPITVTVSEAKHRSIGFGASYSTSEGFGSDVFWEHRNIFGRNEQLRLSLTAAEIEQVLEAGFRKPSFLRPDQALLARTTASNRNTDAFDEQSVEAFVGVERPWRRNWILSGGATAEYSILEDEDGEEEFLLFGLPAKGVRSTADDLLNPTRGTRVTLEATPYVGGIEEGLAFLRSRLGVSAYRALDTDKRFVLAGRARLGTLVGADTETVPANKRFYAGGGGSVRGYEFQSIGPLDDEKDPLGGRSLLEVGGEVRIRITEDIGLVPFVDGGTVFDSPYPDFDETIRWGAGLGLRYFTVVGPIRLDVAVPLNGRDDVDDDYQFYISLGQAF